MYFLIYYHVTKLQRTIQKANEAADKIKTSIANNSEDAVAAISTIKSLKLTPMACDLADLDSIDSFVKEIKSSYSNGGLDAVCYNAGVARNTEVKDVARTKQGFELTVGENSSSFAAPTYHKYQHLTVHVTSLILSYQEQTIWDTFT
jgi:NAD(P)-dependent dehydrogenase (short-subunit alcohol dehydrogenase family)